MVMFRSPHPILASLTLALGIHAALPAAAAPLTNADFAAGLTAWQAQANTVAVSIPDANFSVVAGAAELSTSFDSGGPYDLKLFQDFDMPNVVTLGNGLYLDFNAVWTPDQTGDSWSAQLIELADPAHYVDLTLGSGPFDVTAFAGLSVQLLFGLENLAGSDDRLRISGIQLVEQPSGVPEPASLLLLATGLLAWPWRKA